MNTSFLHVTQPTGSSWRGGRAVIAATLTAALATSLALGVSSGTAFAADTALSAAERHAPSALPDRIILIPTDDPAHSQRVNWRSTAETARAQIVEAPAAFGDVLTKNLETYDIETVDAYRDATVDTGNAGYVNTYHTVEFTNLKSNTRYSYRVGDGTSSDPSTSGSGATSINNWSAWQDFTTAADELEPYSFIYFGDAQNYIDSSVPRVFTQAMLSRPDAKMVLHAGDLMNQTGTSNANLAVQEKEWGEWFQAGTVLNATRNTIATPGNHEYNSSTAISSFWKPQFPFPENGPTEAGSSTVLEAVKQSAYYVDYQGVRYISLDSSPLQNGPLQESVRDAQVAWFEAVLQDTDRPKWTVVTFHHPVYAGTGSRNNSVVREAFNPLIQQYKVDLVLQGHDHVYNRGNNVADDDVSDPTKSHGPVYSISVSGGKMYTLNTGANWDDNGAKLRATGENKQLFQLVDVEQDKLTYQARLANDTFFDGYTVTKAGDSWDGEKTVQDITVDPELELPAAAEPIDTTVSVAANNQEVQAGAELKVTATVTDGVAGKVQFRNGNTALGEPVTVASGVATLTTTALPVGPHALYAVFTPDDLEAYAASTSAPVAVQVAQAVEQQPNPTDATAVETTTTLTTSTKRISYGKTVKLVAKVSGANVAGAVQFRSGSNKIGAPVTVTNGEATLSTKSLSVQSHALTAVFIPADSTKFAASSSAGAKLVVTKAASTVKVSRSAASVRSSGKIKLTIKVSSGADVSGTVKVTDKKTGKTWVTKAKLKNGNVVVTSPKLRGVGKHTLTVTYSGTSTSASATATTSVRVK